MRLHELLYGTPGHRRKVPDRPALLRGVKAHQAGHWSDARDHYARYKQRHPESVVVDYLLASLAHNQGWLEEGLALMLTVVQREPTFALALYNVGKMQQELGEPAKAAKFYHEALRVDPDMVAAWTNLGCAHLDLSQPRRARECFDQAAGMDTDSGEARYNRAHALLVCGAWLQGWQDHETRWTIPGYAADHELADLPRWEGDAHAVNGQRLLVEHEQGQGDTILLARYHGLLVNLGAFPIWRVPPSLTRLLAHTFGEAHVADQSQEAPAAKLVVGAFSLPYLFSTIVRNVPHPEGYLKKQPDTSRRMFHVRNYDQFNIGFVWAGSSTFKNDRNRSTRLEDWAPLFDTIGVTWHVLKIDATDEEKAFLLTRPEMSTTPTPVRDWYDTAAVIAQMDLVITVDTGVAHLAGAMGVPVWILVASSPDFRWLLEREDSVWYNSARLFRQTKRGDWPEVMERVAAALGTTVHGDGWPVQEAIPL